MITSSQSTTTEGMMNAAKVFTYYWPKMQPNGRMNWAAVLEHMVWAGSDNSFVRRATINVWK
jgi:hypothetical protein